MLSGVPPFYAETEAERVQKVMMADLEMKGPIWFDVSNEAKDLIKHMMAPDIVDRYHHANALKHPWFEKASVDTEINLDALHMFNQKEKLK